VTLLPPPSRQVYNIEMLRNTEMIERVKGEQIRDKAVNLIRMVSRLWVFAKLADNSADLATAADVAPVSLDDMDAKFKASITNVFTLYDVSGDGHLDYDEFFAFLNTLGQDPSEDTVKSLMRILDSDGNETVSLEEFLQWMWLQETSDSKDYDLPEVAQHIFKLFDSDGTGHVTPSEMGATMKKLGVKVDDHELSLLIGELDKSGDNQICVNEFLDLLQWSGFVP
jgi:Ca2+-binding EF-hand superfamily protein